MRLFLVTVLALGLSGTGWGQVGDSSPWQEAKTLERNGRTQQAFEAYLKIDGAAHLARDLGRTQPEVFLELMAGSQGSDEHQVDFLVVKGDLLLASGKKEEALKAYRQTIAFLQKEQANLGSAICSENPYPVAPPRDDFSYGEQTRPFSRGPGSHRDNWLIQRFIALEAWDDAEKEFQRIWQMHQAWAHPFIAQVEVPEEIDGKEGCVLNDRLIHPAGFTGKGLLFACDYAFFLKSRGHKEDALAVLKEPIGLIDMDKNPNLAREGEAFEKGAYPSVPVSPFPIRPRARYLQGLYGGISRKEFIRLAFGEYKESGREEELVSLLEKQIEEGRDAARRTLARIRFHQGRLDDALASELAYIEKSGFNELTRTYRRAIVFENNLKQAEAIEAHEKALGFPFQELALPEEDEDEMDAREMRTGRGRRSRGQKRGSRPPSGRDS